MKRKKLSSRINSFLYNHIWLKYIVEYATAFFMSVLSAVIFVFGINTFIAPNIDMNGDAIMTLISGGVSGLSQIATLIYQIITGDSTSNLHSIVYAIAYAIINIPLAILAFKGIGIRFAIFTIVNVVSVSILSSFINTSQLEFICQIATFVNDHGGMLARALFAGMCTGLSSAIAFKYETSTGGIDVVSYYLSLRKSTSAGKYGVILNAFIITTYSILAGFAGINFSEYSAWVSAISGVFFSIVYLFTVMLVIDYINVRNKKVQLQIITKNQQLPTYLLANIPHGATITKGKGAFSDDEQLVIYMVISSFETKQVIALIKSLDPHSFVTVTSLQQVYGRFFIRPVK